MAAQFQAAPAPQRCLVWSGRASSGCIHPQALKIRPLTASLVSLIPNASCRPWTRETCCPGHHTYDWASLLLHAVFSALNLLWMVQQMARSSQRAQQEPRLYPQLLSGTSFR